MPIMPIGYMLLCYVLSESKNVFFTLFLFCFTRFLEQYRIELSCTQTRYRPILQINVIKPVLK